MSDPQKKDVAHIEIHVTFEDAGPTVTTKIEGHNALCILGFAMGIQKLAKLQGIPPQAAVFGLNAVIRDIIQKSDGITMDLGAIEDWRGQYE